MKYQSSPQSKLNQLRMPTEEQNTTSTDDSPTIREIDCEITKEDFEEMVESFDSGMSDHTTHNAAAIALKRKLKDKHFVRFSRDGVHGPYICLIDQQKYTPSCDLEEFFDNIERGIYPEDFHFHINLPEDLLNEVSS